MIITFYFWHAEWLYTYSYICHQESTTMQYLLEWWQFQSCNHNITGIKIYWWSPLDRSYIQVEGGFCTGSRRTCPQWDKSWKLFFRPKIVKVLRPKKYWHTCPPTENNVQAKSSQSLAKFFRSPIAQKLKTNFTERYRRPKLIFELVDH